MPSHERVRLMWWLAYERIAGSAIGTTGLRFVHTNGVESASYCTLGDWRRLVTLGTCCGPTSAPKEMGLRSTWRACQYSVLDPYAMYTPLWSRHRWGRIKRPPLTTASQRCMFVIFATGVFLLREV